MRSKPSDAQSNGSEIHSTVLRTPLHNTIPKFKMRICSVHGVLQAKQGTPTQSLGCVNSIDEKCI
ncbi:hypothetical protein RHMOL_Rhmol01G0266100 [Rhododendron molle]|uniref:Uncharacterized protein n=1 Tax=Rhododendron molle TaxID=49168 RepID=A0ACC0Q6B8_RHOML|nr:hypothetical protein RHMOL_Rhmol01G0266100 [Rhododendron molle]